MPEPVFRNGVPLFEGGIPRVTDDPCDCCGSTPVACSYCRPPGAPSQFQVTLTPSDWTCPGTGIVLPLHNFAGTYLLNARAPGTCCWDYGGVGVGFRISSMQLCIGVIPAWPPAFIRRWSFVAVVTGYEFIDPILLQSSECRGDIVYDSGSIPTPTNCFASISGPVYFPGPQVLNGTPAGSISIAPA